MGRDIKIEEPRKFTPDFFERENEVDSVPRDDIVVAEDGGYWDKDGYYYEKDGFYDPDGNYYVYDDVEEEEAKDVQSKNIPERHAVRPKAKVKAAPPAKSGSRRKKKLIVVLVIVAAVVILVGSLVYYFGFVKAKQNYDAQMKLGAEHFALKEYAEAEEAYLNALEYEPDDAEAVLALAETFTTEKKYDLAVKLLKGMLEADTPDSRVLPRLYSLYIEELGDEASIAAANELTLLCNERGLNPGTDLIPAPPKFKPNGGTFNIATEFVMTAGEDLTIYYTKSSKMPTLKSSKYKKTIILKDNKKNIKFTAVAVDKAGLFSLPAQTKFTIDIQFTTDSQALDYIGKTNKKIASAFGALYYKGYEEGGYYYSTKSGNLFYIFPAESFDKVVITDPETGEPLPIDPATTPLPAKAICSAISMKTSNYVMGMTENVKAEDFVHGLAVEEDEYEVLSGADDADDVGGGGYILTYKVGGLKFQFDMIDKETVSKSGYVLITK